MKRLHTIIALLILFLGVIHLSFAFPIHEWAEGSLWFIGSGVAILLAGLINWIASAPLIGQKTKWVAFSSNMLMCGLFISSLSIIDGPQVFIGVGLFALASFLSIY
jgi:hypothetical protein